MGCSHCCSFSVRLSPDGISANLLPPDGCLLYLQLCLISQPQLCWSVCLCGKAETSHGSSYGHQPFLFSCHSQAKISPWTYMGWKVRVYVRTCVNQWDKNLKCWLTGHPTQPITSVPFTDTESVKGFAVNEWKGVYMRGGGVIKRGEAVYFSDLRWRHDYSAKLHNVFFLAKLPGKEKQLRPGNNKKNDYLCTKHKTQSVSKWHKVPVLFCPVSGFASSWMALGGTQEPVLEITRVVLVCVCLQSMCSDASRIISGFNLGSI